MERATTAHSPGTVVSMDEVVVWVPAARHLAHIAPGSGIVSSQPAQGGRITIDYEGGIYRQVSMEIYANRVFYAWDRQMADYPTVSRIWPPVDHLIRVGTFDATNGVVVVEDREALQSWLGVDADKPEQLICTASMGYVQRRDVLAALASGDPVKVAMARKFAATAGLVDL